MNSTVSNRTSTSGNSTSSSEQTPTSEICPAETFHRAASDLGFHGTPVRAVFKNRHHAVRGIEEESEELDEMAQALLDPIAGNFTEDVSSSLPYVGSSPLVMDKVTLDEPWRGHGLGAILATEAIHRLMAGCRAIACSPGVTDLSSDRLRNRTERDRMTAKIARGWERIGFRHYQGTVYLLSPASLELEEQREAMRGRLAELGVVWRRTQAHGISP